MSALFALLAALLQAFLPEIAISGENGGGGNRTRVTSQPETAAVQENRASVSCDEPRLSLCNTARGGIAAVRTTASVTTAGAALTPEQEETLRQIILIAALASAFIAMTQTAHAGSSESQARIQRIIRDVFPDDQSRALCIADYESDGTRRHWNPAGQNGSNTGLFQIDERTWDWRLNARAIPIVGRLDWSRMHEALYNARAARRIYLYTRATRGNGWLPWSTRSLCGA